MCAEHTVESPSLVTFIGYRRLTDKLLRGIKPADIPWELPDLSHFAINLRTAKALGLTVPADLLLRADQVIE